MTESAPSRGPAKVLSKSSAIGTRIKKIMQSDEDVGKVAAASTYMVGAYI